MHCLQKQLLFHFYYKTWNHNYNHINVLLCSYTNSLRDGLCYFFMYLRMQTDLFFEIMCRLIRVFFSQLVVSNVVKMQKPPLHSPILILFCVTCFLWFGTMKLIRKTHESEWVILEESSNGSNRSSCLQNTRCHLKETTQVVLFELVPCSLS